MSYTVWHNNIGRPIVYDNPNGTEFVYEGSSGVSPGSEREWIDCVERYGHAITVPWSAPTPMNHHMIGVGVGHDDARWAESRFIEGSMAAYYENGEAFGGARWWDETDGGHSTRRPHARKYYDPSMREVA